MAITAKWYPSAAARMFSEDLNASDTFKVALLNGSGTFSGSHTVWSDVSANQISGTGYTSGGATVTMSAPTSDNTKAEYNLGSVSWTGATITFRNAVIYSATTNYLMMHLAFSEDQVVTGQDYVLQAPDPKPNITPA